MGHGSLLSEAIHAWAGQEVKVKVASMVSTRQLAWIAPAAWEISSQVVRGNDFQCNRFPDLEAGSILTRQGFVSGVEP